MQFIDDDMDELFRQAAEDYPLKTDNADWDKVRQQLHPAEQHEPQEIPTGQQREKKRDYKYLWLLLLLPLGFICGRYTGTNNVTKIEVATGEGKQTIITNHRVQQNGGTGANQREVKDKQLTTLSNQVFVPNQVTSKATKTDSSKEKSSFKNREGNINYQSNNGFEKSRNQSLVQLHQRSTYPSQELKTSLTTNIQKRDNSEEEKRSIESTDKEEPVTFHEKSGLDRSAAMATPNPALTDSATPIAANTKRDTIVQQSAIVKNKRKEIKPFRKHLYAGIVAGPDFSSVKKQQINNTGSTVGVLLGYQASKRIAVETGILWDNKAYYSTGEYFNTSKIALPPDVKIINVEGNCKMIELPLDVKYNFLLHKKGNWFIAAGISSYFMKKETYDYLYDHASVQYNGYRSYKNSTQNYFSVLNLSAGYQRQIGKATIRIEPYVKLPLKGIGIGSLPLSSTGLYIIVQGVVH